MGSRRLIQIVTADGWFEVKANRGDHKQFKHATKPGRVTIPHPRKDIPIKTVRSVFRQAGLPKDTE